MGIDKSRDAFECCNTIVVELSPDKLGLAAHNHLHPARNVIRGDVFSRAKVSSVERSFVEAGEIKDGMPESLAWYRTAMD